MGQETGAGTSGTPLAGTQIHPRIDDLVIDVGRARVTRDDVEVALPKLSFDLLLALVEAAPDLVSIESLMERVWPGVVVSPETVSQRVKLCARCSRG